MTRSSYSSSYLGAFGLNRHWDEGSMRTFATLCAVAMLSRSRQLA